MKQFRDIGFVLGGIAGESEEFQDETDDGHKNIQAQETGTHDNDGVHLRLPHLFGGGNEHQPVCRYPINGKHYIDNHPNIGVKNSSHV